MQYLDSHVNYLLSQCAQRIYILKLLRHQGMSSDEIITVAYALILSRIMYALRAWGGFLFAALIDKINAFLSALLFTYIFTYIKGLLLSAPCLISRDNCVLCILSAVFQLRALLYVLYAFVILNKRLLTYLLTRSTQPSTLRGTVK